MRVASKIATEAARLAGGLLLFWEDDTYTFNYHIDYFGCSPEFQNGAVSCEATISAALEANGTPRDDTSSPIYQASVDDALPLANLEISRVAVLRG